VFLAYLAAKTENIRLGHGVKLLPFNYNHPVRVAEQAAVLDLVCGGRLDFGTGRSITRMELEGFGVDPAVTREQWAESLDMIIAAWTNEIFEWNSQAYTIPTRQVLPKPLQKPHPPLWTATTSAAGHELVGRKGLGLLSLTIILPLAELASRISLYHQGLQHAEPVGSYINNQAAGFTLVYCAEDAAQAREEARDGVMAYLTNALDQFAAFARWVDPEEQSYSYLQQMPSIDDIDFDWLLDNDMVIVGDPDECAKQCQKYFDAGLDQLLCCMQHYGVPHRGVMESIRLFGEHVIPRFT
jgi:alkanesulfonate monooxygenase SsuD/methylene tetrahydromethanopterin reductase-like flavin-dependent oxidoreductase (luciferase family)